MQAEVERLTQDTPLERKIAAAAEVMCPINGPTQGAMVENDSVDILGIEGVVATFGTNRFVFVPEAEAKITHNHVRGASNLEREILEGDAVAGCGLASKGDIGFVEREPALERDRARNTKYDGARS